MVKPKGFCLMVTKLPNVKFLFETNIEAFNQRSILAIFDRINKPFIFLVFWHAQMAMQLHSNTTVTK